MPFWRTYYHLVWATKNRQPLIQPDIETRLYAYLFSKAAELNVVVYAINGWVDHLHVVGAIPPKHAVATVVKRLKGASSFYLNHVIRQEEWFKWQRGYGVLTLGERQRSQAEAYVREQKVHHQQQTTNIWLERMDEFDEGPPDAGLSELELLVVKEIAPVYQLWESEQFPF